MDNRSAAYGLACRLDDLLHVMQDDGTEADRRHASWAHALIHDAATHLRPDPKIRATAMQEAVARDEARR